MESNNLSIECLKNKKKVKLVKNKIWNEASYKTCFGMKLFKKRFWNGAILNKVLEWSYFK